VPAAVERSTSEERPFSTGSATGAARAVTKAEAATKREVKCMFAGCWSEKSGGFELRRKEKVR
jgi:hypothetical protein